MTLIALGLVIYGLENFAYITVSNNMKYVVKNKLSKDV